MTYQDIAKDTLYVTVGLGVLAFQRAQVARQELTKVVESQLGDARENLGNLGGSLEDRIKVLEQRFEGLQDQVEERVESFLDEVEDRVPDSAKDWFSAARGAAKDARGQVRHLVNSSRESAAA